MPKPYSVSPLLRTGTKSYVATFRISSGNRICRSLGTTDFNAAQTICLGLTRLHLSGAKSVQDAPSEVSETALSLYFNLERISAAPLKLKADARELEPALDSAQALLSAFPPNQRAQLLPLLVERGQLKQRSDTLALELRRVQEELKRTHSDKRKLEESVVVQAMRSASNAPAWPTALEQYSQHMHATCSARHAKEMKKCAELFLKGLSAQTRVSQITPDSISAFISKQAAQGPPTLRATRFSQWFIRVGAFFNWSAKTWGFTSQMLSLSNVPRHAVDRERGDIHWHTLEEVQKAIANLPDVYWKALVGTLAFAGLQLAELIWLRREDIQLLKEGTRGRFWITSVTDPDDANSRHNLKTANRRRGVDIHPTLLLPLLKQHLETLPATETILFPIPPGIRRRKRDVHASNQSRWLVNSLSTILRGHPGGMQREISKGLLPQGMNAKSLRRTFGSLLLRSGKSTAEVAAAMGNTEDIVRRHYARILGCEVDVDF